MILTNGVIWCICCFDDCCGGLLILVVLMFLRFDVILVNFGGFTVILRFYCLVVLWDVFLLFVVGLVVLLIILVYLL